MKKIVHLLKHKNFRALIAILFVFAVAASTYTAWGIAQNLKLMDADATTSVDYYPPYPQTTSTANDADLIKRGEYLAKAGDCIACHTNTAKKGPAFAGGLALHTPFGTIYSPNITPDKETGIGKWTDAQFNKAMREGISPDGHYYYPAFPYLYFSRLNDGDLKALRAYFAAIPSVSQANHDQEMMVPFNIRFLQLGWRLLFFHGPDIQPYQNDNNQSAEWNQGAYLVDGLGHCSMCHTPSYHLLLPSIPLAAPIKKYNLTGAKIQGYLAPNISKSNLGTIPTEEIIQVFSEDKLIGGGKVEGPMLEVNHDSLRYLSHEDLAAMSNYLKTVVSKSPPVATGGALGKGVYEGYCSGCHANGAGGAPKFGDATAWNPVIKTGIDNVYTNAIHGKGGMPAKGTCISCSDTEIKQAVDYMVAAVSGTAAKVSTGPVRAKPLTMADGKRIYDTNCAVCHNVGFKGAQKPGDMDVWRPIINAGFLDTFLNVKTGRQGHPERGACTDCSDADLKAAVKWMMQQSTTTDNYNLW